jgi:hypothetical protein
VTLSTDHHPQEGRHSCLPILPYLSHWPNIAQETPNPLQDKGFGTESQKLSERRARESNPQPVTRHLISSQEDLSNSSEKQVFSESTGPKTGPCQNNPDLDKLIAAWENLPDCVKQAILFLVQAAIEKHKE